jgi:3-hydroxybutyryl-CoA dehydrogenase
MTSRQTQTVVGVLGAGAMGAGIAQVAAVSGHRVILYDSERAALERAQAGIASNLERLVAKGRLGAGDAAAALGRLRIAHEPGAYDTCGIVLEAIIEDLSAKREALRGVEAAVAPDCMLATNTSSLSITAVAAACENPARVLGVHFFNPAPVMPLVEIIPGLNTDPSVTAKARTLVGAWGKTTVTAGDTPGFIVNRVARPFYGEALRILEEGIADVPTIDWAMKSIGGFRMGPFELMDLIGNDVNYRVTETVFEAFFCDPRYKPSFTQKRLCEANRLGRKTGRGFYDYALGSVRPEPRRDTGLGRTIVMRILAMLINEAADALFWGVASRDDIELAMTKGVNYPQGLLAWADEIGLAAVLDRLRELQSEYGEDRYRPSPLLVKMARQDARFFPGVEW